MLIYPTIPEKQLFKKLTLKIQGQGHGWSRSSKSQCECNIMNILSPHIPLVPCQMTLPFLRYIIFKVWHWKFKVKVENHNVGPTFSRLTFISFRVNRASHSWVATFSKFVLENQGPRSCVRSHRSHKASLRSYRLTSLLFHVNRASHSWVTTLSKFDLENQVSRSWVRSHFKVTMWV